MSDVRYSSQLAVRFDPVVREAINRAAAARRMKASELVRRIVVDNPDVNGNLGSADRDAVSAEPA